MTKAYRIEYSASGTLFDFFEMPNLAHLQKLDEGVSAWNKWRLSQPEEKIDLSGASLVRRNLSWINLIGADLKDADLSDGIYVHAKFTNADLRRARFVASDLTAANLSGANLNHVNFFAAHLKHADLSNTELEGAVFRFTDMSNSDLSGSSIGLTVFVGFDLDTVKGLDSVKHKAPSNLGIDTFLHSSQPLPISFLQGVGMGKDALDILNSLNRKAIGFYSCFISYSTLDQDFADRLHADLQASGVRCWFAAHDIQGGRKVHEQIDEAIKLHDKLLLVLSEHSMQSSWVNTEIAETRAREFRENRRCLFPIRLVSFEDLRDWQCFDADTGKDSAREIREYFIPDFSNWKDHDSYQAAFERLLKDLKATQDKR